jgi:hypothetical protein
MARRRHPKLRGVVRWGVSLLAGGVIGASAGSWISHFGVRWDIMHGDGRDRYSVFMANGRVWVARQPDWILDWEHDRLGVLGVGLWSSRASLNLPMTEPYFFGVDPYMNTNPFGGFFTVQYATGVQHGVYFSGLIGGALVGLSTVPSWIGVGKRRYRRRHGCCVECGYSREGLESNVCPECGEQYA